MKVYTFFKISLTSLIVVFSTNFIAFSMQNYPLLIPNGTINSCSNCHFNPAGGGSRTAFGNAFRSNSFKWNATLAALDSDGDLFTNGEELQDPTGVWDYKTMPNAIGDPSKVTLPGDKTSFPTSVIETNLDLNISNAFPNPIIDGTTFTISNLSNNKLEIFTYDIYGNVINSETIYVNNDKYEYNWLRNSKGNLPNGAYLVDFRIGEFTIRKKVILN